MEAQTKNPPKSYYCAVCDYEGPRGQFIISKMDGKDVKRADGSTFARCKDEVGCDNRTGRIA